VLKTRIDQDGLHQTSGARLQQAREAKKECEGTRKALPDYLTGHLFAFQARRIERHLKACPVCTSELHSLRFAADTKQLMKDLASSEGMGARMEATLLFFGRLRLLLYRPLWILLALLIAGSLYVFVLVPSLHDPELEVIERSLPGAVVSAPVPSLPFPSPAAAPAPSPAPIKKTPASVPVPSVEPLAITITPDDESSMRRINDVMKGHAGLRKLRFTDTVREVSGSLTPAELQTLFGRIEQAGKVSYSRKRLSAMSTAELIPFIMKLKDAAPAPAVSSEKAVPASAAAPSQPVASTPTPSAQP
jgi:hypothetical protein